MTSGWCGIDVLGLRSEDHAWLRRALRDVGLPVFGWSDCVNPGHRQGVSITAYAAGRVVKRAIEDLLFNEVLGYPVTAEVSYG